MKRIFLFLLSVALLLAGCHSASGEQDRGEFAISVIEALAAGEYDWVAGRSDPAMLQAVEEAGGYPAVWAQITDMLGDFRACQKAEEADSQVLVTCDFAFSGAVLSLAVTSDMLLGGLTLAGFLPHEESSAEGAGYVEEEALLRPGQEDETTAVLTLPEGVGPFPAVIFLHGSGASDRDESTAYGLAPFRDLARGLAEFQVASLRYDKYSYAHPELLKEDPTLEREYLLDARAALQILLADERISGIYLLGHSQGAMLLPRIAQNLLPEGGEALKGGILLAGSPKPLWELQYRQNLDALKVAEQTHSPEELARLGVDLDQQRALVEAELEKLDRLESEETFFGLPASYQMDEMRVDAAEAAKENGLPLLIAQGAKDWQVLPEEGIEAWRAALEGSGLEVEYRLYPDMNHLLFDIEGEPTFGVEDYLVPGASTSRELIQDIARWIVSED